MTIENTEALAEITCLAPGEGQKPLYIMTDTNFEALSNPDKFPNGSGCFSASRPRKISYQKYFNQRLLNVDGRFSSDTDYLVTAQYIVEAKKILDDCISLDRNLAMSRLVKPEIHLLLANAYVRTKPISL